jgi:hypothetical protein
MTTENFAYWLKGFVEINGTEPNKEQWQIIKDHLELVFKKETPFYNGFNIQPTIVPYDNGVTSPGFLDNRPIC